MPSGPWEYPTRLHRQFGFQSNPQIQMSCSGVVQIEWYLGVIQRNRITPPNRNRVSITHTAERIILAQCIKTSITIRAKSANSHSNADLKNKKVGTILAHNDRIQPKFL